MGFTFHDSVIAHMIPEKSINNAYCICTLSYHFKKIHQNKFNFFQQYLNIYVKYHIIYKYLILNHFFKTKITENICVAYAIVSCFCLYILKLYTIRYKIKDIDCQKCLKTWESFTSSLFYPMPT